MLRESVAADTERLARFQREAEVLAALNHPNTAQIYGFEESSATIALVMELVEGEDPSEVVGASRWIQRASRRSIMTTRMADV